MAALLWLAAACSTTAASETVTVAGVSERAVQSDGAADLPEEAQELMRDLTRLNREVNELRQVVWTDAEVVAARNNLNLATWYAASADPEFQRITTRLEMLTDQLASADEAGAFEARSAIMSEALYLNQRLTDLQVAAEQQPEVSALRREYEQTLARRTQALTPQLELLLARSKELSTRIEEVIERSQDDHR